MSVSPRLKIGEVAARSGTSIDTIRYYERRGLLPAPERRPSGYRSYGSETLRRLHFILRAKGLGFTLEEISELLGISAQHDVAAIRAAAARKLAGVDTRLAELQRIRDALSTLVDHCPGHGPVTNCPILAALETQPEPDHD